MACCGQKRLALAQGRAPAPEGRAGVTRPSAAAPRPAARAPGEVVLRYRGPAAFQTRSIRTGRVYACAGTGAVLAVDARDAEALVRTGRFAR